MSGAWFFQANPKRYDIDAALEKLDQLWWRVPQYTSEIQVGDVVALWRSGTHAGIVGLGRVACEPQHRPFEEAERVFVLGGNEGTDAVTRVLLRVRQVPFVAKDQVRALPELARHRIITAPMGTVSPLDHGQWTALASLLPDPPPREAPAMGDLPPVFAWEQRSSSVLPVPGGYGGYLPALSRICDFVERERPTTDALADYLEREFDLTTKAVAGRLSFLRRADVITVSGGACWLSDWSRRWRRESDPRVLIALLHSRIRFIGEFLSVTLTPRTSEEVLRIANERYGFSWTTSTQISNRRGWLQSAGMLEIDDARRLVTTATGRALLSELTLHEPSPQAPSAPRQPDPHEQRASETGPSETSVSRTATNAAASVEALVAELEASSTASEDYARFERAVRDAFAFLGFEARWISGSGKTDVLLEAPLGKGSSYQVVVDCKSTRSGAVTDQQIDWLTLREHQAKHKAQHTAVVGPSPQGRRLFDRATEQQVTVISVEQLSAICRQHATAPLGLDSYRKLFTTHGAVQRQPVDDDADEWLRLTSLAAAVCSAIRGRSRRFGPLTAAKLSVLLETEDPVLEEELQPLLDILASPLLGVLAGDKDSSYRITTSPAVVADRLRALATILGPPAAPTDRLDGAR